ncbi:F0F1 ATP synthase subunit epsilon [Falsiroseomonas selenitidurans]|uniref:F0F1 ATP synthase subunit epsilon n=1 Tax=Falsiroseomonas selenitidurans TaxID=2716335 RepID=A0ABX1ECW6_9PROT|nr:F0F1 ATP synthase subunit epsilon [Falsiroseomonas selenitidurans]NKC33608.1 F0F1 ATP synthase subunit epsilon [Falsiroseomonas selenitidurans]
MRLRILTPLSIVTDTEPVLSLRAEDASGGFGIMSGHTNFLTSLTIGVVSWTDGASRQHHCAVRGGVLSVSAGRDIAITTREAVAGDDLATLDATVIAGYRAEIETERAERTDDIRLQLNAIRRIVGQLGGRHGRGQLG